MLVEVEVRNQILAKSELHQSQVAFGVIPQGTSLPHIAIAKISAPRRYTHEGRDAGNESRIQANIYASGYQQAKQLAEKLYALDEYQSNTISNIRTENEIDGFDDGVNRFSVGLDFIVQHYE